MKRFFTQLFNIVKILFLTWRKTIATDVQYLVRFIEAIKLLPSNVLWVGHEDTFDLSAYFVSKGIPLAYLTDILNDFKTAVSDTYGAEAGTTNAAVKSFLDIAAGSEEAAQLIEGGFIQLSDEYSLGVYTKLTQVLVIGHIETKRSYILTNVNASTVYGMAYYYLATKGIV